MVEEQEFTIEIRDARQEDFYESQLLRFNCQGKHSMCLHFMVLYPEHVVHDDTRRMSRVFKEFQMLIKAETYIPGTHWSQRRLGLFAKPVLDTAERFVAAYDQENGAHLNADGILGLLRKLTEKGIMTLAPGIVLPTAEKLQLLIDRVAGLKRAVRELCVDPEMALAFSMSQHRRLGAKSRVPSLNDSILRLILRIPEELAPKSRVAATEVGIVVYDPLLLPVVMDAYPDVEAIQFVPVAPSTHFNLWVWDAATVEGIDGTLRLMRDSGASAKVTTLWVIE